jgi:gluconate 2-dehydrogenase alpha chain
VSVAATRLKPVDAVIVGMGWTGSIMARELTRAGLNVVGLERGAHRTPAEDFTLPGIRDELRYAVRQELFQDTAIETVTLRHAPGETALPIRRWGAFTPGTGLGGAGSHWNGMHWRYLPYDLNPRSHIEARYGRNAIPPEMPIADFGLSWDEIEPFYDRFEKLCGVSGKAGNIGGRKIAGGNMFEGARTSEFPNAPLAQTASGEVFARTTAKLGYNAFPLPASNASAAYTNPEGATLGACVYCGHCERFGCEVNAKASPNTTLLPGLFAEPRFTLRTHAYVKDILFDRKARRATAVRYVDTHSGELFEQPADLVILGGYVFTNTLLMLVSAIGRPYDPATGKGAVGRNYCYQTGASAQVFIKDTAFNPFMGAGALGTNIDDFNGDNFDHGGLGFFGGATIGVSTGGGRPIANRAVPPGTPRWGSRMEEGDGRMVWPFVRHRRCRRQLRPPRKLSRSRSQLSRCAWPPVAAHDLQLSRERLSPVGSCCGRSRADRLCDGCDDRRRPQGAPRRFPHRALSIDPQYRRDDHGRGSVDQRGQSLSAKLGGG